MLFCFFFLFNICFSCRESFNICYNSFTFCRESFNICYNSFTFFFFAVNHTQSNSTLDLCLLYTH
ncbi:hypothetical protein HanIR_Chr17g0892891 [Helianthus annuus]|nr:hypothetical protein HanIR_Chr17g0892891 [Helianthus annuus]